MIGIGDIGSVVLLLAIAAVLVVLLVLGVALLIAHAARRRRAADDARPRRGLLVAGVALVVIAVGVPVVGVVISSATGQPDPLVFDLRHGMDEGELYGDPMPGFQGFYDYHQGRTRLRLPGGRDATMQVKGSVATVTDGEVRSVSISWIAEPPARAAQRVRRWAKQLGLDADGVREAPNDAPHEWSDSTSLPGMRATASLQPVSGGELMMARVRIDLDPKDA